MGEKKIVKMTVRDLPKVIGTLFIGFSRRKNNPGVKKVRQKKLYCIPEMEPVLFYFGNCSKALNNNSNCL